MSVRASPHALITRLAQVYMPVSRRYACFNPSCPLVQCKNDGSGGLDRIKRHLNASVDGAGKKKKHRDALSATDINISLSVSFFGYDQRVTNKLPLRVCSPDARQLPMSNFRSR